ILLTLFGVLLCTLPFLSQDVIRVDVPQVSVDFTVTDSMNHAILDLNRDDVEVFDNGEQRTIQNFSPVKTPYNVVLLLDCSDSMRERLNMLIGSMARFGDQLRPEDKAAIAIFGTEVQLVMDWNLDKQKVAHIPDLPICRGTEFYRALEWAIKKLREANGRRGIVIFTDGRESDVTRKSVKVNGTELRRVVPPIEDRAFQNILKDARASGAPFYFVAVDTDINPGKEFGGAVPDLQQFRARLEVLAEETGGRAVFPKQPTDVVPFFLKIGAELGNSYSLGFSPSKSGDSKPHKIEIRVRGRDYTVHQSRDTYVVK
ncbi:MAG TPA: VWA domain-containing protein, partial [Terriglobia bacterium]|nr:VWA domain-containing protein [Terriglobia bacterium]